MKHYTLVVLLALAVPVSVFAQEREKVTVKSKTPHTTIKEIYQVLKTDKSVKDGYYKYYRGDKLITEGFYANGSKDSVWKTFGYNKDKDIVVATRWYNHGKRTGKWEFTDSKGLADWSYDFATQTANYIQARKENDSLRFYSQSENGYWINTAFDRNPIPLYSKSAWVEYLIHNLYYPQKAMDAGEQGIVTVAVLADENGEATDYSILTSPAISLNDAALEIVKGFSPEFIPAQKNGKAVKVQYRIPVAFSLAVGR